jgi:DNA-binding NarL/FixJ family response regulator
MTKIFISYACKDIKRVKRIVNDIHSLGFDCWMDKRNLQGGDIWTNEIVKAISSCDIFLLFMSSGSMTSDSVRREVQLAFDKKKKIVILRLEEARIPRKLQFQLAGIQWLKARGRNWRLQLIAALEGEYLLEHTAHKQINASGKIRVLLVDDDEMARNAWKKVVSKSSQIQVIGETTLRDLERNIRNIYAPEVIVSGFPFVERGLVRSEKLIKTWGNFPKIIVICENKEQIKAGYKAHADWAAASPFSDQDLVTWIRAMSDDAKRLCSEYLAELVAIQKGSDQAQRFIKLIQGMLQLLFHPDLINPEKLDPLDSSQFFPKSRLLFRNQAKNDTVADKRKIGISTFDEFWKDARQNHESKYIAIDIYNSEITPVAIRVLGKYLTNLHGLFGIIIGRGPIKTRLYPLTVALFENEKKAILLLSDAELQEMLEYKAGGVNPACLLQDLYQKLIADAGN